MASAQAIKRISRELADIKAEGSTEFTARPRSDSDLLNWEVTIFGPNETPYQGGTFKLELVLPPQYPFQPPTLSFVTKIYHPNVLKDGTVCIPLLRTDQWKPACKLLTVIDLAIALLREPNGDDAIEDSVAEVWKNNPVKYIATAKEWTKKYAR
ncbi:ubiquitin-conjugating enzyme/RWD-like protein [Lipomyces japonicus]|uniref:ubiquitin-conjugating enzyme/RWD-like protein n=1 Tax=Lipomyces japonicus TaxID=56871 RepID=UPI0034CF8531